jgi:PAS domain S-box-containing protein
MRMPPGWDGVETIEHLWEQDPELPVVICTAYSDCPWAEIPERLGCNDRFLILKKPFDNTEVLQLALVLSDKRRLAQQATRERKLLESLVHEQTDALEAAHQEVEQLLTAIKSLVVGVDAAGTVTRWNATAEQVFGITACDAIGTPLSNLKIAWVDCNHILQLFDVTKTNDVTRADVPFDSPHGGTRILGLSVYPVMKAASVQGFLCLGRDITEQQKHEQQVRQTQKLEAIGQLAAGVAHEINTPMQFIGDNLHFLQRSFDKLQQLIHVYEALVEALQNGQFADAVLQQIAATREAVNVVFLADEIPEALTEALDGTKRVAEIVAAMKAFAHPGDEEKAFIDLNQAITSTLTVARNEWKYIAELVTDFDPNLPLVPCLAGEFNQVILNLIVNAAHAIGDVVGDGTAGQGIITIRTRYDDMWATIEIADTGSGIPEAMRDNIFDPFFTTKDVGKGTGQGLAIAHDIIINKHGGTLCFETEMGQGTTFYICLPVEPAASSVPTQT